MSTNTLKLYTSAAILSVIALQASSAYAQTPISTAAELSAIRNKLSGEYYLTADIDMSTLPADEAFEPIGTYRTPFTGVLDGRGFEVKNLRVSKRNLTDGRTGLFGQIGEAGEVRNLGVTNASVVGGFAVGALAGANNGIVTQCWSSGRVQALRGAESNAGGLVGHNGGLILRSQSSASVFGGDNVGGLVGFLTIVNKNGVIRKCNASGNVEGNNNVGGLVGYIFGGRVEESSSISRLAKSKTAAQSARHGGLVGTEFFEGRASNNTVGRMPDGSFVKPADIDGIWNKELGGEISSGGGSQIGVTSQEMTDPKTFTDKGWEVTTSVDNAAADGKWLITDNSVPQLVIAAKDDDGNVVNVTQIYTITYAISADAAAQGGVTVNGKPLTAGTPITTTVAAASVGATAAATPKTGHEFVAWLSGGNIISTESVLNHAAAGDAVIEPMFREIPKVPTSIVNFSVYDGIGGSIMAEGNVSGLCPAEQTCTTLVASWLSSNSFDFPVGSSMTIRAVPDSGFTFAAWNDNVNTASRTITVTVGGMNLEAVFARDTGIAVDPCDDVLTVTPNCPNYCTLVPYGAGCASGVEIPKGAHITVAKDGTGMFTSIQAAVNAASPGQVIVILDTETYEEQVTIDGRDNRNWPGHPIKPVVGKRGITIRYVPPAGAAVTARPVLKFRDTFNTSPTGSEEGRIEGDTIGSCGNFETNGALRILHTSDVTIEGLIIDGGGIYPFWGDNAWGTASMAHGNSAVAVVVSDNIQIRDSHLRNAMFGVHVKDRNVGGVYGNKNQADIDTASIVPLSGFGHSGNHLFEYNRIYDNTVGVYFESLWDRGSSVRYNLLYRNYRRTGIAVAGTNAPASMTHTMDWVGGALKFRDNYLSPVAIYNNTLYENERFLANHYQVGGQHLVFNNIVAGPMQNPGNSHGLDGKMPRRMHHNTWSANYGISMQSQGGQTFGQNCDPVKARDTFWINQVSFESFLYNMQNSIRTYACTSWCDYGVGGEPQMQIFHVNMAGPLPGAIMTSATHFPESSVNRWLEMSGRTVTSFNGDTIVLPNLFQSLTEADPNFLEPDWSKQEVIDFIRNKGWGGQGDNVIAPELATGAGVLDWTGTDRADLGAIQYNGKRPCSSTMPFSRARITPYSVVTLSGSGTNKTAVAKINVEEEIASGITGLRIKYIRWIEVPENKGEAEEEVTVHNITPPADLSLSQGSNVITFNLPSTVPATIEYGFFEIVLEGTAGGKTVTTDVGFIPYRDLDYGIKFTVASVGGSPPMYDVREREDGILDSIPIVRVGEPMVLRVTAVNMATGQIFVPTGAMGTPPLQVAYSLLSNPAAAHMWRTLTGSVAADSLAYESNLNNSSPVYQKDYTVYFTGVPDNPNREEIISGAGSLISGTSRLAFFGEQRVIVRSGIPEKVAFLSPMSKSQLPNGVLPPPIGVTEPVEIQAQVQDRFGNATDMAVPVTFQSLQPHIGDIAGVSSTVTTDPVTGIAAINVEVRGGINGEVFDVAASMNIGGGAYFDTASFRVVGVMDPPPAEPDVHPAPPPFGMSIGPNPVSNDGGVALYWNGGAIKSASLYVYSSTGKRVGKLSVKEPSLSSSLNKRGASVPVGKRRIGEWKMRDRRSRPLASGTYLIRGVVVTIDGKREKISIILGVR